MPMGSSGFRWGKQQGKWNLLLKDGVDGSEIDPELTFLGPRRGGRVVLDDFRRAARWCAACRSSGSRRPTARP
jgi:hypothetical protein